MKKKKERNVNRLWLGALIYCHKQHRLTADSKLQLRGFGPTIINWLSWGCWFTSVSAHFSCGVFAEMRWFFICCTFVCFRKRCWTAWISCFVAYPSKATALLWFNSTTTALASLNRGVTKKETQTKLLSNIFSCLSSSKWNYPSLIDIGSWWLSVDPVFQCLFSSSNLSAVRGVTHSISIVTFERLASGNTTT